MDRDNMITSYSTAVSDTASEILGVGARDVVGKSHMPQEIFLTSIGRVGLEKRWYKAERAKKEGKLTKDSEGLILKKEKEEEIKGSFT